MDNARRTELVTLIFDKPFSCLVAPIHLDVAFPAPEPQETAVYDGRTSSAGCVRTVDYSNEIHVLEALYGHARYTGDKTRDAQYATTPESMMLTINQMAEILGVEGSFTFLNPPDSTLIYDTVHEYLVQLERGRMYEPHFQSPPEEDLEKLTRLQEAIAPMVSHIRAHGMGIGGWDEIMALFTAGKGAFVEGRGTRGHREKLKREREEAAAPPPPPPEPPKPSKPTPPPPPKPAAPPKPAPVKVERTVTEKPASGYKTSLNRKRDPYSF